MPLLRKFRRSSFAESLESRHYLTGALGPVTDYPGVTNPSAITLGDFQNSGRADVAVAGIDPNTGLPTVAIYLSNGDGTFATPTYNDLPASPAALDLTTTSLSKSANTDIVVCDPVDAKVYMLTGNGDGTFAAPIVTAYGTPQPAGSNPVGHIASADINFDGEQDLLVTDPADHEIVTLIGNGDGTYTPGTPITGTSTPFLPQNIVALDLDGDGHPDIAYNDGTDPHVFVAIGDGAGNFGVGTPYLVGGAVNAIAAADLNHDNLPDLVVTTSSGAPTDVVDVLLNSGGTFAAAEPESATFQNPGPVVLGDFDGDGKLDILTMNSAGLLDFFKGNGDGSFDAAVQTQPTTGTPTGMASADFNGDVKSDLAFSEINSTLAGGGGIGTASGVTPPALAPSIAGALPASTLPGQKTRISQLVTLHNISASTTVHSALIEFDLSTDVNFDSADTPLISLNKNVTIKPGKSKTVRVNVRAVPAGIAAGDYFVVARITDSTGGVSTTSSASTLNVAQATLILAGVFKKSPSTGHVGKPLAVVITVTNSGNIPATGILPIEVSAFDGTSSFVLADLSQKINIKPGKSATFALKKLLATKADDYNLFVNLDPMNTLGETDTSNNLFSTAFPITVT